MFWTFYDPKNSQSIIHSFDEYTLMIVFICQMFMAWSLVYVMYMMLVKMNKSTDLLLIKVSSFELNLVIGLLSLVHQMLMIIVIMCSVFMWMYHTLPIELGTICNVAKQTEGNFTENYLMIFGAYGEPIEYLQTCFNALATVALGYYSAYHLVRTKNWHKYVKMGVLGVTGVSVRVMSQVIMNRLVIADFTKGKTFMTLFTLYNWAFENMVVASLALILCFLALKMMNHKKNMIKMTSASILIFEIVEVILKLVMAMSIFTMSQSLFFLYLQKLPAHMCEFCDWATSLHSK